MKVIWADDDLIEIEVAASNAVFGGVVHAYASLDAPAEWAGALNGFPTRRDDRRDVVIGTFADDEAGGGAALRFAVIDGAGHCALTVRLRSDRAPEAASATFSLRIEPAALDRFVGALRGSFSAVGSQASLDGLPGV